MFRQDKALAFIRQAEFFAQNFSKDPTTQVGALIVRPGDYTVISRGYNGMPRGVNEAMQVRQMRPLKYAYYEHAERNAIFNCIRSAVQGSVAVCTTYPTVACVRALVSAGVAELHVLSGEPAGIEEHAVTESLLAESGAEMFRIKRAEASGTRLERKIAQYAKYAKEIAPLMSKDPHAESTLLLSKQDFTILADGYSGLPRGADDSRTERYSGPLRQLWVESSARNALYNLARPRLAGCAAFITTAPCVECARALCACGVSQVHHLKPSDSFMSRWADSFETAAAMFSELGIAVHPLSLEEKTATL